MVGLAESKVVVVPRDFRGIRLSGDDRAAAPAVAVRRPRDRGRRRRRPRGGPHGIRAVHGDPRRRAASPRCDRTPTTSPCSSSPSGTTGAQGVMHPTTRRSPRLPRFPAAWARREHRHPHGVDLRSPHRRLSVWRVPPDPLWPDLHRPGHRTADEFVAPPSSGSTTPPGAMPFLVDPLGHLHQDIGAFSRALTRYCCMGAPSRGHGGARPRRRCRRWPCSAGGADRERPRHHRRPRRSGSTRSRRTAGRLGMEVRDGRARRRTGSPVRGRSPSPRAVPLRRLCQAAEATRRQFTEGRLVDTGDLATLDADGYLSISGRTKDINHARR